MDANIDMYLCPCLLDLTRGVQVAAKISSAVYSWQQNPSLVTGGPQESKICILASLVSLSLYYCQNSFFKSLGFIVFCRSHGSSFEPGQAWHKKAVLLSHVCAKGCLAMFTLKFKICIHWRFTTWKANMMIKSIHKCNGKYVLMWCM